MSKWIERQEQRGGELVRWREREKAGEPGIVEREYISSPMRTSAPIPSSVAVSLATGVPARKPAVRRSQPQLDGTKISRVLVSRKALEQIQREGLAHGVEVGGGLWGVRRGETLEIRDACGNGLGGRGERLRLTLDPSYIARMDERHRTVTGLEFAGCWHSHVNVQHGGRATPSDADNRMLVSWFRSGRPADESRDLRQMVSLIVSPRPPQSSWEIDGAAVTESRRWHEPLMTAFVLERADGDRTEAAIVEAELLPEQRHPWQLL